MKFVTLFILISFNIFADDYLIKEMEDLNASLSYDDPAKKELILRLADLYFDTSIKESNIKNIDEQRKRSLELYEQVFYGKEGLQKASGHIAIKTEFQMARLLMKLNNQVDSIKHFKNVFETTNDNNLKRETSFELADWFEKQANFEQTNKYYSEAIKLCNSVDSCNYAHFRKAWLLYKEAKLERAIDELKLSMWDSKGQIREKVLNDYIMFLANKKTNGIKELKELDKLSKKISRPEIIRVMAESFFSAGNRIAGTYFFESINRKTPSLYLESRLLEEHYGNLNWKKVRYFLIRLTKRTQSLNNFNVKELDESKKILRRVIVQIDAENEQEKKYNSEIIQSIDIYLALFPNDELRLKMQEGWLKTQENKELKLVRLKEWIDYEIKNANKSDIVLKFRLSRLALAQQIKKSKEIIFESQEIAKLKNNIDAREYLYIAARQMYEDKDFEKALEIFLKLSNEAVKNKVIDKWAILSQNLALDIYNAKKDYTNLMAQASLWFTVESFINDPKVLSEIAQMKEIHSQAKFEQAVSFGESVNALQTFFEMCKKNIYPKKSCVNAKVLSIKLKDQQKLITLLEREKDEKSLMVEYELMGRFKDAAHLHQKLIKNPSIKETLKIALLFELDQDFENRDKVLKGLIKKLKQQKNIDKDLEKLVFLTLDEAELLDVNALSIKWSLPLKIKLAHRIQVEKPTKISKKILLSQKKFSGPEWSKLILSKIIPLDEKQRKISFYGRSSKYKFQKRVNALKKLVNSIKPYLDGSDSETRVYLLDIANKAYLDFSKEIEKTPLPKDLDEETLKTVYLQLKQMSSPFNKIAQDYSRLIDEEITQINDEVLKTKVVNVLNKQEPDYLNEFVSVRHVGIGLNKLDYSTLKPLRNSLQQNPTSFSTLESLSRFYKENNSQRIASYFNERAKSLSTPENL